MGLTPGDGTPAGPLRIEQKSDHHCMVCFSCRAGGEDWQVAATLRLTFDQSAMIRWQIDLDSRGTDLRIDLVFETAHPGKIHAGMPFDTVERLVVDDDLLPRRLDDNLEKVLLGQRELGEVCTFPFHDFVAICGDHSTVAILAKGLHAYQADACGTITLQLRRAVEWLTRPDLEYRVGDAGPFFYVPEGRCERGITHELAVLITNCDVDDQQFYALNAGFQNPPLVVEISGHGTRTQWQFLAENLPLSSLQFVNDQILARFFNPTGRPQALLQPRLKTEVYGSPETLIDIVPAKEIVTLSVESSPPVLPPLPGKAVTWHNQPAWRVGPNLATPAPEVIQQLKEAITGCRDRLDEISRALESAEGRDRIILQHQVYVLERELLEYQLSARLNKLNLVKPEKDPEAALFTMDDEVAAIGWRLNQLRIKRRIYDYIVQAI